MALSTAEESFIKKQKKKIEYEEAIELIQKNATINIASKNTDIQALQDKMVADVKVKRELIAGL